MANIVWTMSNFILTINFVDPIKNIVFFAFCSTLISLMNGILLGMAIAEDANPTSSSNQHIMRGEPKQNYGACMMKMKASGTDACNASLYPPATTTTTDDLI
jgi:hypothetical protein